jgi:PAS domain S-box-containing protein
MSDPTRAAATLDLRPDAPFPGSLTSPIVLVVDDDPRQRAWLTHLIARGGHSVYEAASGSEALSLCTRIRSEAIRRGQSVQRPDTNVSRLRRTAIDSAVRAVLRDSAHSAGEKADLDALLRTALAEMLDASGLSAGAVLLSSQDGALRSAAMLTGATTYADLLGGLCAAPATLAPFLVRGTATRVPAERLVPEWAANSTLQGVWVVVAPLPAVGRSGGAVVTCCTDERLTAAWLESAPAIANQLAMTVALAQSRLELQRAERSLHERTLSFRHLANAISEVFFVMDARLNETIYVNRAYEKVWGRTCRSLYDAPMSIVDAVHPDDRQLLLDNVAMVQAGHRSHDVGFRVIRPDGETRWVTAHAVPVLDDEGRVYRICGVALDVTERHLAQEAVLESEARYRTLAETSFDAIDLSHDGVIREVNRGFLDMFGYSSEADVVGKPVLDFVAEESVSEVRRRTEANEPGCYEITGRRKDGSRILLEVTSKPHVVNGEPLRLSALRDVTARRQLEDQFRQAQKMEAIGRLAGGVAHDFNNLLTVISGHTELLLLDTEPGGARADGLEQVRKAAEAAAGLTRQLLAFSRQQVIEPRTVVLQDVVKSVRKMLLHLIGEDIDLTTALANDEIKVHIDPGQLEQVLLNLAVNSRDAMPTGGKLTVEARLVDSAEQADLEGGRSALLEVSDTGCGMDAATRARIFEPFFTTKDPGKGTGLGLATVYGIIQQSGGRVTVQSEPGFGTTFRIYLPLADAEAVCDIGRDDVMPVADGTETILLVEDSQPLGDVARRALERHGYMVIQMTSPLEALAMARQPGRRIDLLLTDVVMPQMSGRVLAERVSDLHPEASVLFMSGYTDDATLRHGVSSAETPFIQKPFSPNRLARRVREVLDVRRKVPAG